MNRQHIYSSVWCKNLNSRTNIAMVGVLFRLYLWLDCTFSVSATQIPTLSIRLLEFSHAYAACWSITVYVFNRASLLSMLQKTIVNGISKKQVHAKFGASFLISLYSVCKQNGGLQRNNVDNLWLIWGKSEDSEWVEQGMAYFWFKTLK